MEWERLLNTRRLGGRPPKDELGRSPFNSDHDKIVFSGAFRRLAKKTQVHPLATNDHIHNRLTHSLEVACVGRSLGIRVGQLLSDGGKLPANITAADIGDIVETTCLAHDIGNPPFGHTGEEAIRDWFKTKGSGYLKDMRPEEISDLQTFEGNAQGLRILTSAEYHPFNGGMRLTYATLASFIKYPWTSQFSVGGKRPKEGKFGVFKSELALFHELAEATGLQKRCGDDWFYRHPLVHLMEAADDFCYGLIDLEDGLEMGILQWDKILEVVKPVLDDAAMKQVTEESANVRFGRKPPLIRGKVIAAYIDSASKAFMDNIDGFLSGDCEDLLSKCDPAVKSSVEKAKSLAHTEVFNHPRKVELEIGAYNVLATLLDVMCCAVCEKLERPESMSFRSKRVIDLIGEGTFPDPEKAKWETAGTPPTIKYLALMRVMDFISGMTDNYATYLAKQFNGMGE